MVDCSRWHRHFRNVALVTLAVRSYALLGAATELSESGIIRDPNATSSSSSSTSSTTVVAISGEVNLADRSCSTLASSCSDCFSNGCRYCQASPEEWLPTKPVPSIFDYVCIPSYHQCIDLLQMRPGTQGVRAIAVNKCDEIAEAQAKTTPTPTTPTTTRIPNKETRQYSQAAPSWWPNHWGLFQWLAVGAPAILLVCFCSCFLVWWRRRTKRSVRVAPQSASEAMGFMNKASAQWDFAQVGPMDSTDLEAAKKALAASVNEEISGKLEAQNGRLLGRRCLSFWASNDLQPDLLLELELLLKRYEGLTLSFDADWRRASDATLMALSKLVQRNRGRCKFRTDGLKALEIPVFAMPNTLTSVGEALAGAQEVDSVSLTVPPGMQKGNESTVVALTPLRLSSQEVSLTRQHIGNSGAALACGFVRSWSSRLQIVRLMECSLGDAGATAVARLVGGAKQPASDLRELNLSANSIGNRGAADVADALPYLDSLDRLLLERNQIGWVGAQALAERLPRSNVRELVLGTHLGGNPIGSKGIEYLAKALDDNLSRAAANRAQRLGAVALEDCGIGEGGAKALAEFLPKSNLQVLSVARGGLTDVDAELILMALPNTIVSLDLAGNELSDLTGSRVGDAFYSKPQLAVSLAQNHLTPAIRMLLQEEHGTRLRL
eukprot:TRINITY_DN64950_c0_g1_i1.p1 TRINITY_DN64950_c0_g1~~TRINITY_DN64950_c0_g1_i1.p1  ORF type:complete len:665 (-),score=92.32 TRINITY_DN64950_c0_g1_i1:56-2050(-)